MSIFKIFSRKRNTPEVNKFPTEHDYFPNGEADMIAGTNEVLLILEGKISRSEARNIFVRSVKMSREPFKFDRDRLVSHLSDYCIQYFNNAQVDKYQSYLTALTVARNIFDRSPIDVERDGDGYIW
jgi:hypothetical protein